MKALGTLLVSAPLCIFGYGVLRLVGRADGDYGPGIDWQAAHIVGLIGMVLFIPAVLGLGRMLAPDAWRTATVVATIIGLAATIVQFGADIAFAAQAADKAEMSSLSHDFSAVPGVRIAFYMVGPQLFFLGLVVLAALLAQSRKLPWWSPVLLLVSVLLPVLTLDLMPIAGLGLLVALFPLVQRIGLRTVAQSRRAELSGNSSAAR